MLVGQGGNNLAAVTTVARGRCRGTHHCATCCSNRGKRPSTIPAASAFGYVVTSLSWPFKAFVEQERPVFRASGGL
jgi:hypothetical protein